MIRHTSHVARHTITLYHGVSYPEYASPMVLERQRPHNKSNDSDVFFCFR